MKVILLSICVAAAFAVATAQQSGLYTNFPFCKCVSYPSPYSLSSTVRAYGNGTFCFTLQVGRVPPGSTGYCATKADVRKIEFNVNPSCNIADTVVKATLNGKFTSVGPAFSFPKQGPPGSVILRLTQLGLGRSSNGAKICISLGSKTSGQGCTTLETLCQPPPGAPPGVCTAALFDSNVDCCPTSNANIPSPSPPSPPPPNPPPPPSPHPPHPPPPSPPPPSPSPPPPSPPPPSPKPPSPSPPRPGVPSPPPPSPPPPSPPPPSPPPPSPPPPSPPPPSPPPPSPPPPHPPPPSPSPPSPPPPSPPPPSPPPPSPPPPVPPPPTPCTVCTYLNLENLGSPFPLELNTTQCNDFAYLVMDEMSIAADAENAVIVSPFRLASCSSNQVKVCGSFRSDADGEKLAGYVQEMAARWLDDVTGGCPAYLRNYYTAITITGDGDTPSSAPESCLYAQASTSCTLKAPPFPKCKCVTAMGATPFAIKPSATVMKTEDYKLYCFDITVIPVNNPNSPCGRTTTLLKAEFWADDDQRRAVQGINVLPAGDDSWKTLAATWGAVGEQTLKATPLKWTLQQANGGKICLVLDPDTDMNTFCLYGGNTCWANLFDVDKNCCPLFASDVPP